MTQTEEMLLRLTDVEERVTKLEEERVTKLEEERVTKLEDPTELLGEREAPQPIGPTGDDVSGGTTGGGTTGTSAAAVVDAHAANVATGDAADELDEKEKEDANE